MELEPLIFCLREVRGLASPLFCGGLPPVGDAGHGGSYSLKIDIRVFGRVNLTSTKEKLGTLTHNNGTIMI